MLRNSPFLSALLFLLFFILGFTISNSPLKSNINLAENAGAQLKHLFGRGLYVEPLNGYTSPEQYNQDIIHYNIAVSLHPSERIINGTTIIKGVFLKQINDTIYLNFHDNMEISNLSVNGMEADYDLSGSTLKIFDFQSSGDAFIVKTEYTGTPKRLGLASFVFGEINGNSLVYTLNEPNYASTWFPCNDIPDDKALLDIHITNDSAKTSVSNGKLMSVKSGGNRKTYSWKTFYPISTYLIAIYSADYVNFKDYYISESKDTLLLDYYAIPEHEEAAKIDFAGHAAMMEVFSGLFGPYPFMKEKYGVAEFLWQMGAMEHQTITGIGTNFVSGRNFFEDVYVHELAHHWWGNAVGPATWKDIWLNEGFATYSEALYYEAESGKKALMSTMSAKFSSSFRGTLYQPRDLFSQTVYNKGAWVLHMLRKETGDSVFFKILRDFFETFKYSNASTYQFKELAENVSGKDLNQFFKQWVFEGTGIIKLKFSWKPEPAGGVRIDIRQVQNEYADYVFPLDIKVVGESGKVYLKTVLVDGVEKSFLIDIPETPAGAEADPEGWLLAEILE